MSIASRISIGMPVYNGEKYICKALDSILEQTFTDFELIISDNASTDRTREICLQYAARDRRVRYSRNKENIGAARNFNRLVELSSGEFFMWAGDHDVWDRTFVSRCVEALTKNRKAVLCYSQVMIIGPENEVLGLSPTSLDTSNLDDPSARFRKTIREVRFCEMIYGLIRSSVLRQTSIMVPVISPDYLLLAELSLEGTFVQIPEVLFYTRRNRLGESQREAEQRQIKFMWPERKRFLFAHVVLQYLPLMLRQLTLVRTASLSFGARIWLMADTVCFFVARARLLERIGNTIFKRS